MILPVSLLSSCFSHWSTPSLSFLLTDTLKISILCLSLRLISLKLPPFLEFSSNLPSPFSRRSDSAASFVEQRSTEQTSWGCTVASATRSWSTTSATSRNPAGKKSLKAGDQKKKLVQAQIFCNLTKTVQVFSCPIVSSPRLCLPNSAQQISNLQPEASSCALKKQAICWIMKLVEVFCRCQVVCHPLTLRLLNSPQTIRLLQTRASSRLRRPPFCKCVSRGVKKLVWLINYKDSILYK